MEDFSTFQHRFLNRQKVDTRKGIWSQETRSNTQSPMDRQLPLLVELTLVKCNQRLVVYPEANDKFANDRFAVGLLGSSCPVGEQLPCWGAVVLLGSSCPVGEQLSNPCLHGNMDVGATTMMINNKCFLPMTC